MFDIEFYMKAHALKKRLLKGDELERDYVFDKLEEFRSREPIIYNIETTNACNMRCKMCPRTTMMTRPIENLDMKTFSRIVDQIKPFPSDLWADWEDFVQREYQVPKNDVSENHYFLYVIPKIIQLHGYGDPLLDKNMPGYVKLLKEKGFSPYFSCNPANINVEKTIELFENGLSYIKYSMESVDDTHHKQIRGKASNFSDSYKKILTLLEAKKKKKYDTTIVITMLNLNRTEQKKEYEMLKQAFAGLDVYVYLKSEDQLWYRKDYHATQSIHWGELCQHPWMSMTIKSNGEAAMCMEDFNNEIVLGNAKRESLATIWDSKKYSKFRQDHFFLTRGIKCTEQCDMKLFGNMNLKGDLGCKSLMN